MLSIHTAASAANGPTRFDRVSFTPYPSPRLQIAGLRAEWRRIARRLTDPDVELDPETFAAVQSVHSRLVALRAIVDPLADALIRKLAQQLDDARLV